MDRFFKEGELDDSAVRKESLLTSADGKKYKTNFYNLDVIISVGFRVNTYIKMQETSPQELLSNIQ